MSDLPIIDAHQHFWDPRTNYHPWLCDEPLIPFRYGDYSPIRRPYLPPDYFGDARGHAIVQTVYVETEWDPRDPIGETRWVQEVAARYGVPNAIVAQAWLDREDVEAVLAAHARVPLVRGVRHKPRSAPHPAAARRGEPGSMDDPRWRAGFALLGVHGFSFDLQTPWWHLDAAADLAADFPQTTIILNHTGLPADRSPAGLTGWRQAMEQLAAQRNTAVKISGLGLADRPWRLEDNRPIVRETLAIFGVDRCMFGSNFPVDSLCGTFDTIFSGFQACVAHLPPQDRRKLFHDNPARVYRLRGSAPGKGGGAGPSSTVRG